MMVNIHKFNNTEWVLYFHFINEYERTHLFNEVYDWFNGNFPDKEEVFMGWPSGNSTLSVFIKSESACVYSTLRWL